MERWFIYLKLDYAWEWEIVCRFCTYTLEKICLSQFFLHLYYIIYNVRLRIFLVIYTVK